MKEPAIASTQEDAPETGEAIATNAPLPPAPPPLPPIGEQPAEPQAPQVSKDVSVPAPEEPGVSNQRAPQEQRSAPAADSGERPGQHRAERSEATNARPAPTTTTTSQPDRPAPTAESLEPASDAQRMPGTKEVADPRPAAVVRAESVQREIEVERTTPVAPRQAQSAPATNAQSDNQAAAERIVVERAPAAPPEAPRPAADFARPSSLLAAQEESPSTPAPVLVRGLAALAGQKGGTLHMRLDPPSLGDVKITMTIGRGIVTADISVANPATHALLAADLSSLRVALERQGLHVDRLSLHHAPPARSAEVAAHAPANAGDSARSEQGQTRQEQQASSRQERHDAGGNASRGRGEQEPQRRGRAPRADFERVWFELAEQA